MDKYRPFLTEVERLEYDGVREAQRAHHEALRLLRDQYLRLGQVGRSRARASLSAQGNGNAHNS